jgi:hypothetical protein
VAGFFLVRGFPLAAPTKPFRSSRFSFSDALPQLVQFAKLCFDPVMFCLNLILINLRRMFHIPIDFIHENRLQFNTTPRAVKLSGVRRIATKVGC